MSNVVPLRAPSPKSKTYLVWLCELPKPIPVLADSVVFGRKYVDFTRGADVVATFDVEVFAGYALKSRKKRS